MTTTTTTVLAGMLAVLAAALGAAATYLVARRRTSGQIATSEAATLWEAAEQIRRELRDEVEALRAQAQRAQAQVASLLEQIDRLQERLAKYERPGNG